VRFRDGRVEERRVADPLGSPARPVGRDGILAKASRLLGDDWAAAAAQVASDVAGSRPLADVLAPLREARYSGS
jgi:hypothetical protein